MALFQPSEIDIPDRSPNSKLTVGTEGAPYAQDDQKSINRMGAGAEDADVDIGTSSSPHDLDSGNNNFSSGIRSVGGATELSGQIISDDNAQFNIKVDWVDDDGNVAITHAKPALQGVTDVYFNIIMRSDRFKLRVEDASGGQNRVHGSSNSH